MGLAKLWGKDPTNGNRGFVFSHVKTCYYNWNSKTLLKDKLDQTDETIESIKNSQTLTLFAANWSENYPYSQTVVVDGIKETDTPFIGLYLPAGLTEDNIDDQKKAFDDLYRAESGNGYITFYAYKKPVLDFQVIVKGV